MRKLSLKASILGFALAWGTASGQSVSSGTSSGSSQSVTVQSSNICLVCGDSGVINNTAKIIVTSFGLFSCGGLEGAGLHGNIRASDCSSAQKVALDKCGCGLNHGTTLSQGSNNASPSCHICPNAGLVTRPDGVVAIPGTSQKTCSDYQQAALAGSISSMQCAEIQRFANETCGCMSSNQVDNLNRPIASNETFVCPVCGSGMRSSKPWATVALPGRSDRTCGQFEHAASLGKISRQQCPLLQPFVQSSCSCKTGSPVASPPTPPPSTFDCAICGQDYVVTRPQGVVVIPTQPDRTCAHLVRANAMGKISSGQCSLLKPFVKKPCGCTLKGNTSQPTVMPTDAPSLAPTVAKEPTISPAPTGWATQKPGCFDNLMEIYQIEKKIKDPSVRRRYILCPQTTFKLGHLTNDGRISQGDAYIMLRPNVIYQCGEDGSRLNNCILKGGDFGLTSFYGVYDGIYETVDNVHIQGLTFQSQILFAAVMEAAGGIEFTDCAFKDHGNMAPVLMQWRGGGPKAPVSSTRDRKLRSSTGSLAALLFKERVTSAPASQEELESVRRRLQRTSSAYQQVVTFRNCVFRGNYVTENMGFPGIIENSFGSSLNIINCLFQDNTYGSNNNPAPFGYAVRSYGSLNVESSCFMDNTFLENGPVEVYGAPHTTSNNYVRSQQSNLTCDFLAVFSTQDDTSGIKPVCFQPGATSCPFSQPPTMAPTQPSRNLSPVQLPEKKKQAATSGSSSTQRGCLGSLLGASALLLWAILSS